MVPGVRPASEASDLLRREPRRHAQHLGLFEPQLCHPSASQRPHRVVGNLVLGHRRRELPILTLPPHPNAPCGPGGQLLLCLEILTQPPEEEGPALDDAVIQDFCRGPGAGVDRPFGPTAVVRPALVARALWMHELVDFPSQRRHRDARVPGEDRPGGPLALRFRAVHVTHVNLPCSVRMVGLAASARATPPGATCGPNETPAKGTRWRGAIEIGSRRAGHVGQAAPYPGPTQMVPGQLIPGSYQVQVDNPSGPWMTVPPYQRSVGQIVGYLEGDCETIALRIWHPRDDSVGLARSDDSKLEITDLASDQAQEAQCAAGHCALINEGSQLILSRWEWIRYDRYAYPVWISSLSVGRQAEATYERPRRRAAVVVQPVPASYCPVHRTVAR